MTRSFQTDSADANRALQENLQRGVPGIVASYAMVGAILLLGGAGYLMDRWLGTLPLFLLAGLLAGISFGFYEIVSSVRRS